VNRNDISRKAFTLIELLIVVAIIAILAAIAVPNFLEAQTRSKVSRTKADMRAMATALEAYYTDANAYPNCHSFGIIVRNNPGDPEILERLSTPIAYITSTVVKDPFTIKARKSAATAAALAAATPIAVSPTTDLVARINSYIYQSWNSDQRYVLPPDGFSNPGLPRKSTAWLLHSAGPDGTYHNLGGVLANDFEIDGPILLIYDPTNGTVSDGSVYRSGGASSGNAVGSPYAAGKGLMQAITHQN
jgi:prepilin-type N-terminal cleavage/methylation domain-containing protein